MTCRDARYSLAELMRRLDPPSSTAGRLLAALADALSGGPEALLDNLQDGCLITTYRFYLTDF
jgi:hypothetical protein